MGKLDKCLYIVELLSNGRRMSLREINDAWEYSSFYDEKIIERTFGRYKEYISDTFFIDIEYDASSRGYYISNLDFKTNNALYKYILSAFHVQQLVRLAMKHKNRVSLMEAPSGVEHLHTILKAIDEGCIIEYQYHSYTQRTTTTKQRVPCFLKTWEQRWYLVAESLTNQVPAVYALERMSNIKILPEKRKPSKQLTLDSYFEGSYGIDHEDYPAKLIKIKIYGHQVEYVRAKPIHESQQEMETCEEWSVFSYLLKPCYNFYQNLLWHRELLEVLEPEEVRGEMREMAGGILKRYK